MRVVPLERCINATLGMVLALLLSNECYKIKLSGWECTHSHDVVGLIDRPFQNREREIMRLLDHPNIVRLHEDFIATEVRQWLSPFCFLPDPNEREGHPNSSLPCTRVHARNGPLCLQELSSYYSARSSCLPQGTANAHRPLIAIDSRSGCCAVVHLSTSTKRELSTPTWHLSP